MHFESLLTDKNEPSLTRAVSSTDTAKAVVSVVIPSYQAANHIRGCLSALSVQDFPLQYEIIVVDSSDEGTDQIVSTEFPSVKLLHFNKRCSVGAARNIGAAEATGEIVLFTDTDCVPERSWIRRMYAAIVLDGADGVCGAMDNGTPGSISGTVGYYLEFFRFVGGEEAPAESEFLVGGNSGYRREVLQQHLYLDENAGEDILFSWALARMGKTLRFVPQASVKHSNRTGFKTVWQYQRKLGRAAFQYRSVVSPGSVAILRNLPFLVWGIPFLALLWISSLFLVRRLYSDLAKFLILSPLCLWAHSGWALGFLDEIRASPAPARANGKLDREVV